MGNVPQDLAAALGDRYLLEKEIGAGGMATVYLARDLRHKRPVALKVIRPELVGREGVERFLREIELAARLQHLAPRRRTWERRVRICGSSSPWRLRLAPTLGRREFVGCSTASIFHRCIYR